jgi:hypothetical protein
MLENSESVQITIQLWQLIIAAAVFIVPTSLKLISVYLRHRWGLVFVTKADCAQCKQETNDDLADGDRLFGKLQARDGLTLLAMGMAIINICNKTEADCGDLPALMQKLGRRAAEN